MLQCTFNASLLNSPLKYRQFPTLPYSSTPSSFSKVLVCLFTLLKPPYPHSLKCDYVFTLPLSPPLTSSSPAIYFHVFYSATFFRLLFVLLFLKPPTFSDTTSVCLTLIFWGTFTSLLYLILPLTFHSLKYC